MTTNIMLLSTLLTSTVTSQTVFLRICPASQSVSLTYKAHSPCTFQDFSLCPLPLFTSSPACMLIYISEGKGLALLFRCC